MRKIKPHQVAQIVTQSYNLKNRSFEAWINYTSIITPMIPAFKQFMADETVGTFYSERFKKPNPYNFTIKVNAETAEAIKNLWL